MFYQKRNKIDWRRHLNPDGSMGGLVAPTATLGKDVIMADSAIILPEAKVPDKEVVEAGSIYTEYGPFIFTK